jgi:hypothetical protein
VEITPATRAFLIALEDLLDERAWPRLDRGAVAVHPGRDCVGVVLAHRDDPDLALDLTVSDDMVVVQYGVEHQHFTDQGEALRFVEMLGDGRVRLVVTRSVLCNRIRSYRDGEDLPFARTLEPWLNLRPRTETRRFGFA